VETFEKEKKNWSVAGPTRRLSGKIEEGVAPCVSGRSLVQFRARESTLREKTQKFWGSKKTLKGACPGGSRGKSFKARSRVGLPESLKQREEKERFS